MSISPYKLLPFRFRKICDQYLLVSETGQFHFVSRDDLQRLIYNKLDTGESLFSDLKGKDIVCLEYNSSIIKILAAKYRTKKKHIFDSTALHMMVLTYRCNQRCLYCHASSESDSFGTLDMSIETANKCLNFAFETPSPSIKIEFQGGEPTLNFATLEASVQYGQELAKTYNKTVDFVICTNLFDLDDYKLSFLYENRVQVSTSLDGPKELHDRCRPSATDSGSYDRFCKNLFRVRDRFEGQIPSALLTVSRHNLKYLKTVVDEYLALGLNSIFVRMLNPFGRAHESWGDLCYDVDQFAREYLAVLDYIIDINKKGTFFIEEYAAILLRRILTPFPCGFVDLQSPAGAATSGIIYDPDGDIFVSDEARMLKRAVGDSHFCLGNVYSDDRASAFHSNRLREVVEASVIEALPGCAWCAYQSYCGSDPVRNYHLFGDYVSFKPNDPYCRLNMTIFDNLFRRLANMDKNTEAVIWSWLTGIGPDFTDEKNANAHV